MQPRNIWFKNRITDLLTYLSEVQKIEDWKEYKEKAHEIATELMYICTEWDKYYRDIDEKMTKYKE